MGENYTFENILDIINSEIKSVKFTYEPQSLFEPITYTLAIGGKRIRPSLVLIAYNLYKKDIEKTIPAALGIELFHNFTLLHDDLMDNAEVRRGKPTVHVRWNNNVAILSGDAMLIEAYKMIGKIETPYLSAVLDEFSTMATQICCGQQYDMEFESRTNVSVEEYLEMIKLKTAVLLGCALKTGAILAGAPQSDIQNLYNYGINIGLAFQLKDDLLDVYGDPLTFGKKIGGDILCNKKTFLLISALAEKPVYDELIDWINKKAYDNDEKVKAITNIYNKLNLKEKSEELIRVYYNRAINNLNGLKVPKEATGILYNISDYLISRNL